MPDTVSFLFKNSLVEKALPFTFPVTSVDVSNDLRNAKVFYSVLNPKIKIESIENEMNKLRKAFRKYLGSQLNTKNTPELKFYIDDSHKYTEEIDKLIKEIKSD